jgi:K+-transporting ATPase A subunit
MPDVLLAYAISALLVAIVFVAAFLLRSVLARARFLNLVGLVIVAIALLEKAGWSARPWTLGSPAAAFNDLLFRILLLVGFGLLFVAQLREAR